MESQCEMVLNYMKEHGSITQNDANYKLGVSRLSARISDLKARGHNIHDTTITVVNRYGRKTRVSEYSLYDGR